LDKRERFATVSSLRCNRVLYINKYNKGQVNWVQPFKLLEFEGFFYPLIPAGESPEKGKGGVFKGRSYLGSLSPDQGVNTPP
jgi:hypothetical protein